MGSQPGLLLTAALLSSALPSSALTTDGDVKAQLLSQYRLRSMHPVAAAAQLGLDTPETCTGSHTEVNLSLIHI